MAMNTGGVQKAGREARQSGGFTIVETLIVLAVTSALLLSAIQLINGRQAKTQFQTGITSLRQKFEQIINETQSGFYQNNGNFSCHAGTPLVINATAASQGTNGDCIFIGKVISFTGMGVNKYTVYPLAGRRLASDGTEVTTYAKAWPTAISRGSSHNTTAPDDATDYATPYGLTFQWARYNGGAKRAPSTANAVAIMSSLAAYDPTNPTALVSSSQQFGLYGFHDWTSYSNHVAVTENINAEAGLLAASGMFLQLDKAEFCYASPGSDKQSGLMAVSNGLVVTLTIHSGTDCA